MMSDPVARQLGEYELHERLGVGGMSAVYKGFQPKLRRYVAIKVLLPELAEQTKYRERFDREAQLVAGLQHSHIVPIFDYGWENDISYFVMPLLTGGTLAERVRRQPTVGADFRSLDAVATMLKQVGGALHYAHSNGIVHRDIKPTNILFDTHGTPFIADFGIATLIESATIDLNRVDVVMGTYAFMCPEMWYGGEPTPAMDQYALGLVVYALVTGHAPFSAKTNALAELMHKHLNETPVRLHVLRQEATEEMSEVVEKAIAKQPQDRFSSVLEFADAFEHAVKSAKRHFLFRDHRPPSLAKTNHDISQEAVEDAEQQEKRLVQKNVTGSKEKAMFNPNDEPYDEDWMKQVTRVSSSLRVTRTKLSDQGKLNTKIFISYRRSDSADITGRIYDRLVERFGRDLIFRDLDSIPLGTNFRRYLQNVVSKCVVELVVIGRTWANISDDSGQRRLDNPDDFVRVEVEAALGSDIPVIPLLVQDAVMPRKDQLPSSLHELVYCHGMPIRSDPDFHNDMDRLIKSLEMLLDM
jgi:serine/threonine protein kinase